MKSKAKKAYERNKKLSKHCNRFSANIGYIVSDKQNNMNAR